MECTSNGPGSNLEGGLVRGGRSVFLAVLPSFLFNFNQDFNLFSLGVEVGRALNRRLAVQVGYVEHLAGRDTFSRGFTVGIRYLWGKDHSKP